MLSSEFLFNNKVLSFHVENLVLVPTLPPGVFFYSLAVYLSFIHSCVYWCGFFGWLILFLVGIMPA